MRVLFVEDEEDWLQEVSAELVLLDSSVCVVPARSSASAVALIEDEEEEFDLIICDLRIPPSDGGLAIDESQGLFVQTRARKTRPGVPCMFLTGNATAKNIGESLSLGENKDIFGTREQFPMVVYFSKEQLPEAITWTRKFVENRLGLSEIVVNREPTGLIPDHVELGLQVFARRNDGSSVDIEPLGGGLSGAHTYRAAVKSQSGVRALVFAKFESRSAILAEIQQYNRCLPTRLGPATFASYADDITAGLGSKGALFYQLATGFDRSLFDLIEDDDAAAAAAVEKLYEKVGPWLTTRENASIRIHDFRNKVVKDKVLAGYQAELGDDNQTFEESEATVSICYQHGDLHGENVLVDSLGEPLMIDFGDLGPAPACLDPIVLELSLLFHPQGREAIGKWATAEVAKHWYDVETWAAASPVPNFVRACRKWASAAAASESELLCVAYRQALRQLNYSDTDKDVAIAIANSACTAALHALLGSK